MKIIFLDVDGVLNNNQNTIRMFEKIGRLRTFEIMKRDFDIFDNKSLKYISKIIDRYEDNIRIVISSTWRNNPKAVDKIIEKISQYTKSWNITFSKTGKDAKGIRGNEIENYLKNNHLEKEDYVIIDDDTADIIGDKYKGEMNFKEHFVWCNNEFGFKKEEYKKVIKILDKKK